MARVARIVVAGLPHHITQRGNNRQKVFFTEADRGVYLALLAEEAKRWGLRVLGYCLMANHVHLVAIPGQARALAKAIGRTHFRYAQYVNRRQRRSGHLWQGRFYSCVLDGKHGWAALRYVERNPVRAGVVRAAWRYRWSSAAVHCAGKDRRGLLDLRLWRRSWEAESWREWLREGEEERQVQAIRGRTRTGRPLGSEAFLSKLERAVGRRLRPLPVGRPRKRRGGKK